MFDRIIALCRPGFEKECAAELQAHANAAGFPAYARTRTGSALVELVGSSGQPADSLFEVIDFDRLIFTRQWFASGELVTGLPDSNRITPLLRLIKPFGLHYCDIELAHADTNEGKSISRFCRQFRPHLLAALKQQRLLSAQAGQRLHILFVDSHTAFVGYAKTTNSAAQPMGILRLKMPPAAPSRSTLKLEEALRIFISEEDSRQFIKAGMKAVDLGAAPGGWSWQLVRRGMLVTAVDNGAMDASLMHSGMVEHVRADAFKWQPEKAVDWLVCDMVERPLQVSRLICRWFTRHQCQYSIFNLKLPMNQRYASVAECLDHIHSRLSEAGIRFELRARQLYHDREEITVFLRRLHAAECPDRD